MIIDVSAFVGPYPYRHLPDPSASFLLRELDRVGIDEAWIGHLPSFLYADPAAGNDALLKFLVGHRERLHPVPTIHPGLPAWEVDLDRALSAGAPAIRMYPMQQAVPPDSDIVKAVVGGVAEAGLPVVLTVRFEDVRQRHPMDRSVDLPPSAVRTVIRAHASIRLLVTHASRAFIEEVHFGLTSEEASRILWDITWLWGPPTDDLGVLVGTMGADRFVVGTGTPLRIPDAAVAKLDLADIPSHQRELIHGENLLGWRSRR